MAQAVAFIGEGRMDEAKAICEQVLDGNEGPLSPDYMVRAW